MNKEKALFILHYSPPIHGASKVGDSIRSSKIILDNLSVKFIKVKSSKNLNEIGKFNLIKVFHFIELFLKVGYNLLIFRPKIIYYTASPSGFAFYRDLMISLCLKLYSKIKSCETFYHYHARGINDFVSSNIRARKLTNFFVNGVNLIFISKIMQNEIVLLKGYKSTFFLKNGVNSTLSSHDFEGIVESRIKTKAINVLYLSNMILNKGYDTALELAKKIKEQKKDGIKFHFAGGWSSEKDKLFFNDYMNKNQLQGIVTYHGLVQGKVKKELFIKANMFVFPSRYKKEVFPLSILEALSYGLPIMAFNVGAVKEIITEDVGFLTKKDRIFDTFNLMCNTGLNKEAYIKCRTAFLENYTVNVFERNLLSILKSRLI